MAAQLKAYQEAMQKPEVQQQMQQMQSVMGNPQLQAKLQSLRNDPEFAGFFQELQAGGMQVGVNTLVGGQHSRSWVCVSAPASRFASEMPCCCWYVAAEMACMAACAWQAHKQCISLEHRGCEVWTVEVTKRERPGHPPRT